MKDIVQSTSLFHFDRPNKIMQLVGQKEVTLTSAHLIERYPLQGNFATTEEVEAFETEKANIAAEKKRKRKAKASTVQPPPQEAADETVTKKKKKRSRAKDAEVEEERTLPDEERPRKKARKTAQPPADNDVLMEEPSTTVQLPMAEPLTTAPVPGPSVTAPVPGPSTIATPVAQPSGPSSDDEFDKEPSPFKLAMILSQQKRLGLEGEDDDPFI